MLRDTFRAGTFVLWEMHPSTDGATFCRDCIRTLAGYNSARHSLSHAISTLHRSKSNWLDRETINGLTRRHMNVEQKTIRIVCCRHAKHQKSVKLVVVTKNSVALKRGWFGSGCKVLRI